MANLLTNFKTKHLVKEALRTKEVTPYRNRVRADFTWTVKATSPTPAIDQRSAQVVALTPRRPKEPTPSSPRRYGDLGLARVA